MILVSNSFKITNEGYCAIGEEYLRKDILSKKKHLMTADMFIVENCLCKQMRMVMGGKNEK